VIKRLPEPGPVPEVVDTLRDLLARAEAGEIIGIAVGAACNGRADASTYALGEGSIASLVLALERCKVRLMQHAEGP
jgi:hypothetical protein